MVLLSAADDGDGACKVELSIILEVVGAVVTPVRLLRELFSDKSIFVYMCVQYCEGNTLS